MRHQTNHGNAGSVKPQLSQYVPFWAPVTPLTNLSPSSEDTVALVIWTAAEIAVTMICIGIPVCRPLYKCCLEKWTSRDASKYHQKSGEALSYPLQTFGGSTLRPRQGGNYDSSDLRRGGDPIALEERELGLRGPCTKSYVVGGSQVRGDNQSEEEILGPDFRRSTNG